MVRTNLKLQSDRRAEILAAAQRCFAGSGFHQTSMQEICAEAGMSPGNLYRYFRSKEAIIAGIAERNRAQAAQQFAALEQAPDFFSGLAKLANHHLIERAPEEIGLCTEIMAESRRNPEVARLYEGIEREVKDRLVAALHRAAARGDIDAGVDFEGAAVVLMALSDGLSWRRAVDPGFSAGSVLPLVLEMTRCMLTRGRRSEETAT